MDGRECEGERTKAGTGPGMFANQLERVAPKSHAALASVCERIVVREGLEMFDDRIHAHPGRRGNTACN